MLGSVVAGFAFFFLPILEIKPNRLASGTTFGLLELQGDTRYLILFVLALTPMVLAFVTQQGRRGWSLVAVGYLVMYLTLLLPAIGGAQLLVNVDSLFEEGTRISNPRIFTSGAIAIGLLGGYIIMFGGLADLRLDGTPRWQRSVVMLGSLFAIYLLISGGGIDPYSIMVEFYERGDTLGQRIIEHVVFVLISLFAGLIIGIALGLWAARDSRVEPTILYAVGIIQTIPSLALFGVLLVPLARLGDQPANSTLATLGAAALVGLVLLGVYIFTARSLPERAKALLLIVTAFALFIPLMILAVIVIAFGFDVVLNIFRAEDLQQWGGLVASGFAGVIALLLAERISSNPRFEKRAAQARIAILILSLVGVAILLVQSGSRILGGDLSGLTVRDLGVSGIGTAPALIALTLYSLLPLVRNTYAGLKNIDAAIIDSGRGMGMTPSQVFFQIELPLAFPVIMAGVRNAGISLVGIAAVASIIGAGALGDFILLGVNTTSVDLILLGAIPAIVLAIALDLGFQLLESFLTSPGIRQVTR